MGESPPGHGLLRDYGERFAKSAAIYERARKTIPSGINHDIRWIPPFPVYIERAEGAYKWDVDGNRFIDYAAGHGALILGHGHPRVLRAIEDQARKVTHASAPTELEVEWSELITQLVPSAEKVRFVVSGTEATMLALRVARAHTGKSTVVRVQGHFHGWHDYGMIAWLSPYDVPSSCGVPAAIKSTMRPVALHDLGAVERALAVGDVAAVIVEPDGPSVGTVPVPPGYLQGLRDVTRRYGALLIFDEVVTGFRLAPGGAQEYFGVHADLAAFAKAIAGGLPAGAVAGRSDVMATLEQHGASSSDRMTRTVHMGTYSAHPMGAAAGIAALKLLADGSIQDQIATLADRLCVALNQVLRRARVSGCIYGLRSSFHVLLGGDDLPVGAEPEEFVHAVSPVRLLEGTRQPLRSALHRALLLEGIDILGGNHGWLTAAHTEADVDATAIAFEHAITSLNQEGVLRG